MMLLNTVSIHECVTPVSSSVTVIIITDDQMMSQILTGTSFPA